MSPYLYTQPDVDTLDVFQFIAAIVDSLAWPATFFLLVVFLHRPALKILSHLKLFKYGNMELEFERTLERLEEEVSAGPTYDASSRPAAETEPPPHDLSGREEAEVRFERLAEISPESAIISAWVEVEAALRDLASRHGIDARRGWGSSLINSLQSKGLIDKHFLRFLHQLRNLRNQAVHGGGDVAITTEDARRYKKISNEMIVALTGQPKQ